MEVPDELPTQDLINFAAQTVDQPVQEQPPSLVLSTQNPTEDPNIDTSMCRPVDDPPRAEAFLNIMARKDAPGAAGLLYKGPLPVVSEANS